MILVAVLAVAPLTPFLAPDPVSTPTEPRSGTLDSLDDRLYRLTERTEPPADPVEGEVLVTLRLERGAQTPLRYSVDVQEAYTRQGARHLRGYVSLTEVRALSTDPRVEAVRIERSQLQPTANVAGGVAAIGADDLHRAGLTGGNVTVGVIDTGFRVSDPEIAANVGAYRSFGLTDDYWAHGTAVASVVADTAPDARLHLAAVGTSTTPEEYREAVDWLSASGADVIIDAGSYFGQPGDGSGELAAVASEASRETVFVAAAGNYGQRHWSGTHNASESEWVAFTPDNQENHLNGGEPFAGRVQVSVHWDDWENTTDDYDLYLFRDRPGGDTVVARGSADPDAPVEHLAATVPRGQYYVAVRATNATGPRHLGLFTSHDLRYRSYRGSLTAPGTAPGVLTVGALTGSGDVARFSSRGPVDGRTGLDLVAPDSVAAPGTDAGNGTSYAAPYVAGTAALLLDANPTLSADDVRAVLRSSAVDVGNSGPDAESGYGRLDARAAATLAEEYERYGAVNESEPGSETAV